MQLARSRAIHLLHGGVLVLFGLCAPLLPLLLGGSLLLALPAMITGVGFGVWVLTSDPPPLGSRRGQLLVATSWLQPTVSMVPFLPAAAPVLIGYGFVAPLAAFRLTQRPQIAAHCGAALACVGVPALLGLGDTAYVVGVLALLPALVMSPIGVAWVLETAEQRGQQLSELSLHDPLTGAGNRRLLRQRLAHEVPRHTRDGQPFGLIALDLNGFKQLNDVHGHQAGDDALITVAATLRRTLRAADTITRIGGDEFVLLLPGSERRTTQQLAHAVRAAVATVQTPAGVLSTGVGTASFPADGVDPEMLLAAADAALLADKRARGAEALR